jgi:diaminopimelate epimerase
LLVLSLEVQDRRGIQRAVCQCIFADDMARLTFSKWQGTGNDFIVVDDRDGRFPSTDHHLVRHLCDRHFGIGSDGLILIQTSKTEGTAYHMEFFNPDASQSFCGNGSRCAFAAFSLAQGHPQGTLRSETIRFTAIDGEHAAIWSAGLVSIGMRDVAGIERIDDRMDFIHTGSPHLLIWVEDPEAIDIIAQARIHRYGARFKKEGVNVNFLCWKKDHLEMRTYERGVEGETLSCGTGVTAAALSAMDRGLSKDVCAVLTRGGELRVSAERSFDGGFRSITLAGPVKEVFSGEVEI